MLNKNDNMEDQASYGDVMTNKERIETLIRKIEEYCGRLIQAGDEKSVSLVDYEKEIAITILKLKNGAIETWEGQEVKNLPATLIPVVAKGICFKYSFDKEIGDTNYKTIIVTIEAMKSQLNALQSLIKIVQ